MLWSISNWISFIIQDNGIQAIPIIHKDDGIEYKVKWISFLIQDIGIQAIPIIHKDDGIAYKVKWLSLIHI